MRHCLAPILPCWSRSKLHSGSRVGIALLPLASRTCFSGFLCRFTSICTSPEWLSGLSLGTLSVCCFLSGCSRLLILFPQLFLTTLTFVRVLLTLRIQQSVCRFESFCCKSWNVHPNILIPVTSLLLPPWGLPGPFGKATGEIISDSSFIFPSLPLLLSLPIFHPVGPLASVLPVR